MKILNGLAPLGRKMALLAAPLALSLTAITGAASAQDWKEVQVPIGGGNTITVQGPPRIVYFPAGGGNNYMAAAAKAVEDLAAEIPGATLVTMDANWDALKQINMIENAITSGNYNAVIIDALDPYAECDVITKAPAAANIAVVTISVAVCGKHLEPDGHNAVSDGVIGAVGNNSINATHSVLERVVEKSPGPQKVLILTGPPLHPLSPQIDAAVERIASEHPEFEIVANVKTNFSTIDTFNKVQPVLLANPDITVIYSAYSDITQGAIKALKQADMLDTVKVYEQFGDQQSIDSIKAGELHITTGVFPRGARTAAFNFIKKAFAGEPFDRVVMGDGGPAPADTSTWSGATIYDATNIDTYVPEF